MVQVLKITARISDFRKSYDPYKENSDYIANAGYSDQAHFQREFKAYTGITPRTFIKELTP